MQETQNQEAQERRKRILKRPEMVMEMTVLTPVEKYKVNKLKEWYDVKMSKIDLKYRLKDLKQFSIKIFRN